jgi:hypothetical protein
MEASTTTLLLLLAMSTSNVSNKLMESSTITDNKIEEKICSNETMMEAPTLSNIYFCSLLPVNLFQTQMGHVQQTIKMVPFLDIF